MLRFEPIQAGPIKLMMKMIGESNNCICFANSAQVTEGDSKDENAGYRGQNEI
jgi:hypothetical protein